ncbi:HAD family hydrolase [Chloroflexota bacterium]
MKYKAVIFDLYGTLVRTWPPEENKNALRQMASYVSAPAHDFVQLWYDTFSQRMTGEFSDCQANIRYICERLGVSPEETMVEIAAKFRFDMTKRELMTPRPDARQTLSGLKLAGLITGLLSNCNAATPIIWKDTVFAPLIDVPVFSYTTGLMKPDPQIFQLAIERLAVPPESCLYVADGVDSELDVAAEIGMHPILIRVSDENDWGPYQIDEKDWDGIKISSLGEVLDLL